CSRVQRSLPCRPRSFHDAPPPTHIHPLSLHDALPILGESRKAFYEYHSLLMEPWDGPACVAFTDGRLAGAVLDRNGLRPARYVMTDDTVVLASEIGVVDIDESAVIARGRLTPGRMFLVDTETERIISDTEIKNQLATQHPYQDWVKRSSKRLEELPTRVHVT